MTKPVISVITPTYNSSKTIEQTVTSVLNQTFTDFEYIIVDDGSTDNTVELVKNIDDSRIVLLTKENGGASSARNLGVQNAKADVICFIDSDDLWLKDKLKIDYETFKNSEYEEKALLGSFYMINEKDEIVHLSPLFKYKGYVAEEQKFAPQLLSPGTLMINKSIIEKIGYFSTKYYYHEDYDFGIRLVADFPIICSQNRLLLYRYYPSSKGKKCLDNYEDKNSHAQILRNFFEEHKGRYSEPFQREAIDSCYRSEIFALLSLKNNISGARQLYEDKISDKKAFAKTLRGLFVLISIKSGINFVILIRQIIQKLYYIYFKLSKPYNE